MPELTTTNIKPYIPSTIIRANDKLVAQLRGGISIILYDPTAKFRLEDIYLPYLSTDEKFVLSQLKSKLNKEPQLGLNSKIEGEKFQEYEVNPQDWIIKLSHAYLYNVGFLRAFKQQKVNRQFAPLWALAHLYIEGNEYTKKSLSRYINANMTVVQFDHSTETVYVAHQYALKSSENDGAILDNIKSIDGIVSVNAKIYGLVVPIPFSKLPSSKINLQGIIDYPDAVAALFLMNQRNYEQFLSATLLGDTPINVDYLLPSSLYTNSDSILLSCLDLCLIKHSSKKLSKKLVDGRIPREISIIS